MKTYEEFLDYLKNNGHKMTNQRKIIFNALLEYQETHITVEELYENIKVDHPEMSIATLYRNIQLLTEMGVVNKINLDDGFTRYEIANDNGKHRHHHLICTNCDKVIDVEEDLMDSAEYILDKNYGFYVTNHQTKFYGLCEECRKKQMSNTMFQKV